MEEIECKEIGIQWITMPFDFFSDMNMMIFREIAIFFFPFFIFLVGNLGFFGG